MKKTISDFEQEDALDWFIPKYRRKRVWFSVSLRRRTLELLKKQLEKMDKYQSIETPVFFHSWHPGLKEEIVVKSRIPHPGPIYLDSLETALKIEGFIPSPPHIPYAHKTRGVANTIRIGHIERHPVYVPMKEENYLGSDDGDKTPRNG